MTFGRCFGGHKNVESEEVVTLSVESFEMWRLCRGFERTSSGSPSRRAKFGVSDCGLVSIVAPIRCRFAGRVRCLASSAETTTCDIESAMQLLGFLISTAGEAKPSTTADSNLFWESGITLLSDSYDDNSEHERLRGTIAFGAIEPAGAVFGLGTSGDRAASTVGTAACPENSGPL